MKINSLTILSIVTFFSFQLAIGMYLDNINLRRELRLSEKNKEISNDQIEDLMYTVSKLESEKNSISTQYFIAGVLDTLKNKDHYNEVWHDGYNRGENVSRFASEVKSTKFTADK